MTKTAQIELISGDTDHAWDVRPINPSKEQSVLQNRQIQSGQSPARHEASGQVDSVEMPIKMELDTDRITSSAGLSDRSANMDVPSHAKR